MSRLKLNVVFIASLVAVFLAISAIVYVFTMSTGKYTLDSGTFVGICTTFIGISVTMLIGYQIYNSFEIKSKLEIIGELKEEISTTKQANQILQHEVYEAIHILQSRDRRLRDTYNPNALLHIMEAIPHSLSLRHKVDGYEYLIEELEVNMMNILMPSFGSGSIEVYQDGVNNLRELLAPKDMEIRTHENYICIKMEYERLWSKFNIRLNLISQQKNPSLMYLDLESGQEPEVLNRRSN